MIFLEYSRIKIIALQKMIKKNVLRRSKCETSLEGPFLIFNHIVGQFILSIGMKNNNLIFYDFFSFFSDKSSVSKISYKLVSAA